MKSGDVPINPTGEPVNGCAPTYGLTKREYFAGLALKGCLSYGGYDKPEHAAADAVMYADALLVELNK